MPHDFPRGRSPPVFRPSPSTQVLSGSKSHFAAGQLTSKFQKMAVAAPVKAAKVNTTVESECHLPVSSEREIFLSSEGETTLRPEPASEPAVDTRTRAPRGDARRRMDLGDAHRCDMRVFRALRLRIRRVARPMAPVRGLAKGIGFGCRPLPRVGVFCLCLMSGAIR